ncbi:hypothetical protein RhiirC2_793062 [Rhizophagus irregularis]|uniref:Uncharacterized protein n=1 Tax=Rhizophagus irregularis TaxID=588596 RepID=A0A2N1MG42_9GLOM|nr:hypothetical protein RhiirC2_793062 [Rhizophagus irregularis]
MILIYILYISALHELAQAFQAELSQAIIKLACTDNSTLDNISTILDDDDLNHLNINLNELNTLESDGNNNSTLIHKKEGKKKDKKCGKPNEIKSYYLILKYSKVTYNIKMEYLNAISSNEDSNSTQLNTNYKKNDNIIPDFTKAYKTLIHFFRHIAEFNEEQMLKIIEKIGKDKFIAVVSDVEAAMQSVKRKAKTILQKCQKIVTFFHDEYRAEDALCKKIKKNNIKLILSEQPDIFVNVVKVKAIIQNRQFWYDVEQLKMVLNPAKNAIIP